MTQINFEDIIAGQKVAVLSGKEKGIATRQRFALDRLDGIEGRIEVIIPNTLEIMTPSFVAGMFAASVRKRGSIEGFFEKYQFNASPRIIEQVRDGARSSMLTGSALSSL